MTWPASADDRRLVQAAARRLALQAAAVVAASVLGLTALAGLLAVRQQHEAADATLRGATTQADDVGDPPADTWLALVSRTGAVAVTPGMPPALPYRQDLTGVGRSGLSVVRDVHVAGREYRVRTARRPNGTVAQAVLDLRPSHSEQTRLVAALLSVGALGLLVAGLIGGLLGRRAVRPLADALARQRAFVADASHELRTPLTLLSTRVQLLQRALPPEGTDPELARRIEGVAADTSRMVQLVEDLLLTADRGATGELGAVDLTALAVELVRSAADHAGERQVRLEGPAVPTPVLVVGTHVALRRAVLAVLDNAIEHSPAGGVVRLVTSQDRVTGVLTVEDTGPGLAAPDVDRVFDRFHSGRQKSGRRSYGLGLHLARDVAHRFGGTLTISSTGVDGSVFRFCLPAAGSSCG